MSENCPLCGNEVSPDKRNVEYGEDGLPIAISVVAGLGVPVVDVSATYGLHIMLNGERVSHAVAFDRATGLLWRYQVIGDRIVQRDGETVIEKVAGVVTLANDGKTGVAA